MHPGLHGTALGGGPLACAVAIEFLKQLDKLRGHVTKLGAYFLDELQEVKANRSSIKEVRGMGLMLAIDLDSADTAKSIVSQLLAKGILINRTHDTVLRFLPPYIAEKRHVDEVIHALDSALLAVNATTHQGQKITRRKSAAA